MKFKAEHIMVDEEGRLYGLQIIVASVDLDYLIEYNADNQTLSVYHVNFENYTIMGLIPLWDDKLDNLRRRTKKFLKYFQQPSLTKCILYNADFRKLYNLCFK